MHIQDIKPDLMVHARYVESAAATHGLYVGTVERVEAGSYIRLKSYDSPDGRCHWIPVAWVVDVDDKAVYLCKTPDEVDREMLDSVPRLLH